MSNKDTYEKIEAYLSGTLQGAELTAFERAIREDKALSKQVRLFRDMDTVLSDKATLDFQKMVAAEGNAFLNPKEKKKEPARLLRYPSFRMAAAAVLLLIASAAGLLSGSELFAQHFETYPLNPDMRSGDAGQSTFEQGIEQYQSKDFIAAAQIFQELSQTDNQDMSLAFCLANAYLNQIPPQLDLASEALQKIISNGESVYVPKAKWYQAMILLKKEDTVAAKKLLEDLVEISGNLSRQAEEVLKDL